MARLALFCIFGTSVAFLPAQDTAAKRAPDVRYEPSPRPVMDKMLEVANVKKSDVVYDLGCGDGRVVIAAVKTSGARGVGIDIDPVRIGEAVENARKARVAERVQFRNQDLFEADIHDATVVMLFLSPEVNLKLRPKLWNDLKPGTRVISHCHDMGDWRPERKIEVGDHTVYYWTIPARPPSRE